MLIVNQSDGGRGPVKPHVAIIVGAAPEGNFIFYNKRRRYVKNDTIW